MRRNRRLAQEGHSLMTVVTGRRRIGKTSLALKALREENAPDGGEGCVPTVYLFVSRQNESALCAEYSKIVSEQLSLYLPGKIASFAEMFRLLLETGKHRHFNLIIDEFQDFSYVNQGIYSEMQNLWDAYRKDTNINLVIMGSVYSMMHRIFEDCKEPLFGRSDSFVRLTPFPTEVLKEIMADYRTGYTNDELLAFYTITGGVPKYVELMTQFSDLTVEGMVNYALSADSPMLEEGRALLIQELGREYGVYFSILKAIAAGKTTRGEIEAALNGQSVGGQLTRLIEDYGLIEVNRPILAKERTKAVRYRIKDNFLKFWFAYVERYRSVVEMGNLSRLRQIVLNDYPTYSGLMLEKYFRQKMAESGDYRFIGGYWETKGEANEIDIVALGIDSDKALVVEVKRQRKNFSPEIFEKKVEHLRTKLLSGYEIFTRCLDLEDM